MSTSRLLILVLAAACAEPQLDQEVAAVDSTDARDFLRVSGAGLTRCNQAVRLKGANLEGFRDTSNTMWPDYWNDRNVLIGLLDHARTLGSNSIRLVFPDGAVSLESTGRVRPAELDKLDDYLTLMADRGIGAIVTVFNRHDYVNADHNRDRAKIKSFLDRFGKDVRVAMWDIVNEPPLGPTGTRAAILTWLGAMRDAFDTMGHMQPITIGAIGHYDVVIAEGHRSVIELSDVVSVHCYGRYKAGVTPIALDGVNYRDDKYCGASVHYVKNNTTKPVLLEEFGWPDRESAQWPPAHPWGIMDYPRDAANQDAMYAEVLGAMDTQGAVGAIQWALQDTPDDGFGLITRENGAKRAGTGGAYDRFRGWGGGNVRALGKKCDTGGGGGQPAIDPRPDGSKSQLFADTSSQRGAGNDWASCRGKADCAAGEAINGISIDPNGHHGRRGLCRPHTSAFTAQQVAVISVAGGTDQRRAQRVVDWDNGFWKLECGAGEYVAGVAENANVCQGNRRFYGLQCARGNNLPSGGLGNACTRRAIDGADDRGTVSAGDWDSGAFKMECRANEYVAGVSVRVSNGEPHALLCCAR